MEGSIYQEAFMVISDNSVFSSETEAPFIEKLRDTLSP